MSQTIEFNSIYSKKTNTYSNKTHLCNLLIYNIKHVRYLGPLEKQSLWDILYVLKFVNIFMPWIQKQHWSSNRRVSSQNRLNPFLEKFRYLRFKLLKYKENNKKMYDTFNHNFRYISLCIMSNVSLERYYFVLYDGVLTLKISKMARNSFYNMTIINLINKWYDHYWIHMHKAVQFRTIKCTSFYSFAMCVQGGGGGER